MDIDKIVKLKAGIKSYLPSYYKDLSIFEKETISNNAFHKWLYDYEEYYDTKFLELIQNFIDNELNNFPYSKYKIFYLLENYLDKFRYSEDIINNFEYKLETDMEDKNSSIFVKLCDCPRNHVDVRLKLYEISFENDILNVTLIKNEFIHTYNISTYWR